MAERLAPGVWHEGPAADPPGGVRPEDDPRFEKAKQKRDGAVWLMVSGVGMMFLGSFNVAMALGGAAMTVTGAMGTFLYGRRLKALKGDPWNDPEIDAWERENFP